MEKSHALTFDPIFIIAAGLLSITSITAVFPISVRAQPDILDALARNRAARILNVRSLGASGSLRTVDVTVSSGSTSALAGGDTADFAPGQAITILRVGDPPAVAPPAGLAGNPAS